MLSSDSCFKYLFTDVLIGTGTTTGNFIGYSIHVSYFIVLLDPNIGHSIDVSCFIVLLDPFIRIKVDRHNAQFHTHQ